ncbi:homocysteine S-methyltransferase [Flammeovirga sp. SubArs3]|uniref:homocysteine S-methyltransferase n=1 Tax=Flammeovirga sp. SubArs3 TaxID=2995316 RepID=UPI00248B8B0F|nr:homocysteine S-methyltransferase [Flammeovirga sp. SubArs3]
MEKNTLLLDGGLSNALEDLGYDLNHELWSAKLLIENPQAIIDAHLLYLEAGADIIITSSYQSTIEGWEKQGYTYQEAIVLLEKSTTLALEARKVYHQKYSSDKRIWIAGSIGPYGAYLADGSEYRGNYSLSIKDLIEFHTERVKVIDHTKIDLLAFETIPSFDEVKAISSLLSTTQHKGWITVSCKNERELNDGTPIKEVAEYLSNQKNLFGFGVNCTKPEFISELIQDITSTTLSTRVIVYPNAGLVYDSNEKKWRGTAEPLGCEFMAKQWKKAGANVIGGCCQMGPDHISSMKKGLS